MAGRALASLCPRGPARSSTARALVSALPSCPAALAGASFNRMHGLFATARLFVAADADTTPADAAAAAAACEEPLLERLWLAGPNNPCAPLRAAFLALLRAAVASSAAVTPAAPVHIPAVGPIRDSPAASPSPRHLSAAAFAAFARVAYEGLCPAPPTVPVGAPFSLVDVAEEAAALLISVLSGPASARTATVAAEAVGAGADVSPAARAVGCILGCGDASERVGADEQAGEGDGSREHSQGDARRRVTRALELCTRARKAGLQVSVGEGSWVRARRGKMGCRNNEEVDIWHVEVRWQLARASASRPHQHVYRRAS